MGTHPSVSDASFSRANLPLLQIPFPSENGAESKPKQDFLPPNLNKNFKIQPLTPDNHSSPQKLAGALFQTMDVTDKERCKAHGTRPKANVGGWRSAQVQLAHLRSRLEALFKYQ